MATVVIFEPGKEPVLLKSVNTPDYEGNINAIINPDTSSVDSLPKKYWKRSGNSIVSMTSKEKSDADATNLANRKSIADTLSVQLKDALEALIKVINLRLPANQKITKQELIDAIKKEIL